MTERNDNLFDLLGSDGEQYRVKEEPPKPEATAPTEGAVKLAEKEKIDLGEVKGTGKDGRIVQGDVQKVVTQRAAERARKNQQQNAGSKEPDVYDKDRVARYAGQAIPVPTREMSLEQVREMLEETFPELSRERTEMLYDEEKGLVIPVLKAHRKGSTQPIAVHREVPHDSPNRPVFYMLGRDGVYEVRQTQAGQFVARVETGRDIREGFVMRTPPIPVRVLGKVVHSFRNNPETELMANICHGRGGYYVEWPDQEGTSSTVSAAGRMETDEDFIVLQIHSHGTMRAFFSGTDDADEVRTGLYGVVGRCDQDRPEIMLRYSVGGTYRLLGPGETLSLFDAGDAELRRIVDILGPWARELAGGGRTA